MAPPTRPGPPHQTSAGPPNLPIQTDATLHRCTVYDTGAISFGNHRTSVGRAHIGSTVTAICDRDRATIYHADGRPLGHVHLDPAKNYITLTPAT